MPLFLLISHRKMMD